MADRYDVFVNGAKAMTASFGSLPPVGATVVFADGSTAEVIQAVYPTDRRIRLECKTAPKPTLQAVAEPAVSPKEDLAEAKESLAKGKNLVDDRRGRR